MSLPTHADHEIYVWDAHELLEDLHKAKEGVHSATEANDRMKSTIHADIVALAQLVQSGTKIGQQIRLLGVMGHAYIKDTKGKSYIIFKGAAGLRPNLSGTRYLTSTAKVRCFVVGGKDIMKDTLKGTKIAIIAFVVIDIVAELSSDRPSLASLGVQVSSDVLQAVVASAAGYGAGVLMLLMLPAAPVVLVFAAVVAAGFAVGFTLSLLDTKYGLTDKAKARMRGYEDNLKAKWPVIENNAILLERSAQPYLNKAKDEALREAYKVDRYFRSAEEMIIADTKHLFK